MEKIKLTILLLILFFISSYAEINEKFANSLYENGNYHEAVLEYERLCFFNKDNSHMPFWKYRLGLAHFNLENYSKAINSFNALKNKTNYSDSAKLRIAESFIILDKPSVVDSILCNLTIPEAFFVRGYSMFLLNKFSSARELWSNIDSTNYLFVKSSSIINIAEDINKIRNKNYITAGALSLFPGLGHVYTKRYGDGFFSFSIISVFSGITYYYYYHGATTRAYTFGTITGLFYTGSIYGSLVSVKLYNRSIKQNLLDKAKRLFKK